MSYVYVLRNTHAATTKYYSTLQHALDAAFSDMCGCFNPLLEATVTSAATLTDETAFPSADSLYLNPMMSITRIPIEE